MGPPPPPPIDEWIDGCPLGSTGACGPVGGLWGACGGPLGDLRGTFGGPVEGPVGGAVEGFLTERYVECLVYMQVNAVIDEKLLN